MTATVPQTRVEPVTDVLHGEAIVDPYRWLEEDDSAETRAWTEAQNRYTAAVLDRLPGRDALRDRRLTKGSSCASLLHYTSVARHRGASAGDREAASGRSYCQV